MKSLGRLRNGWEYELNQREAMCLRTLLREFPLTPAFAARASKTESGHRAAEREQLLRESLAEHRKDLKREAAKLVAANRLKPGQDGWRLRLKPKERETLLQLLNDIRVGCWHALGEPEDLEPKAAALSEPEMRFHSLMQLAGYFECGLLNLDSEPDGGTCAR